tara:strand:+ start:314 stop:1360 length:1047 start_codon:yes stop_codon:yes gene_type:complete
METQQNKQMAKEVMVIAEAGVNHNGNFQNAIKLIDQAAFAGADFIKFQTFKARNLSTKKAKKAKYQIKSKSVDESQYKMLKALEVPLNWYPKIIKHCKKRGIKFLSSGFDCDSIDFLDKLNLMLFKIPSGEINHKTLLKHVARKNKNIILSTGMSTITEIREALDILISEGISKEKVTILHCTTQYPTALKNVNLRAMLDIKKRFKVKVGYSDHTEGIEVSIAAVALGAQVIEKHFTLDKKLVGPDHKASLDPYELKKMIEGIKNVSQAISGSGIKEPTFDELENIESIRKSLCYLNRLPKGTIIKENHLIALRPGDTVNPMEIDSFIGKQLIRDVDIYQKLNKKDFK